MRCIAYDAQTVHVGVGLRRSEEEARNLLYQMHCKAVEEDPDFVLPQVTQHGAQEF